MKAVGGEIGSASALAPKLGPLGLVSLSLSRKLCVPEKPLSLKPPCLTSLSLILLTVAEEGRRGYSEGHYGLEGNQSDRQTQCHQSCGEWPLNIVPASWLSRFPDISSSVLSSFPYSLLSDCVPSRFSADSDDIRQHINTSRINDE